MIDLQQASFLYQGELEPLLFSLTALFGLYFANGYLYLAMIIGESYILWLYHSGLIVLVYRLFIWEQKTSWKKEKVIRDEVEFRV
jgi:hypothetical protein